MSPRRTSSPSSRMKRPLKQCFELKYISINTKVSATDVNIAARRCLTTSRPSPSPSQSRQTRHCRTIHFPPRRHKPPFANHFDGRAGSYQLGPQAQVVQRPPPR